MALWLLTDVWADWREKFSASSPSCPEAPVLYRRREDKPSSVKSHGYYRPSTA